jgi:hypothetical protein
MPLCSKVFGLCVFDILFCAEANPPFDNRSYSKTWSPTAGCHNLVLLGIRYTFSFLDYGNDCKLAIQVSFLHSIRTFSMDAQYDERYVAD